MKKEFEYTVTLTIKKPDKPYWEVFGYKSKEEYDRKTIVGFHTKNGVMWFGGDGNEIKGKIYPDV